MASESSNSRSSSSVDSYIGSLISLTSKSEIRYEGVLYNINTEESSIGLRNVRSFGTEARKPDGPHIPPSDKVYEYILFRGSDIKDLQVKSSPPVQPPPQPINNDPAIIQSHYPQVQVSSSTSLPSAVSGPAPDLSSHNAQFGLPASNFQGALPLYQPGANLGSWGAPPSQPTGNGNGLAMPMYWQGYYGPNGMPMHQQALLRPPLGMPMPPSMQHPLQYPNFNASLPTGPSNLHGPSFPEIPSHFLPSNNNPAVSNSSVLSPETLPSSSSLLSPPAMLPSSSSLLSPLALTSTLPPATSTTIVPETSLSMKPNRTPISTSTTTVLNASVPVPPPVVTPTPELSPIVPPIDNMPNGVSGQTVPYHSTSLSTPSTAGASNTTQTGLPTPPLSSSHKDVEVVQVSHKEPSAPVAKGSQPPILPLPVRSHQKPNGAHYQNRHGYRGRERGRGSGSSRPVAKFTEEFDFVAMNEKFNKEEVWGDLGKSSKSNPNDKEGDGTADDEYDYQDEDDAELSKVETKPVYNKDDFFDTISCHALDRDSNGRTKFSEQRKIDTETFGEFARFRGGRGPGRGGGYRGGHYGRGGHGYARGRGRGRGRAIPDQTSPARLNEPRGRPIRDQAPSARLNGSQGRPIRDQAPPARLNEG